MNKDINAFRNREMAALTCHVLCRVRTVLVSPILPARCFGKEASGVAVGVSRCRSSGVVLRGQFARHLAGGRAGEEKPKTHFGFQDVTEEEKSQMGDVAIRIARFAKILRPRPGDADPAQRAEGQIIVCDINKAMLNVGERKAERIGLANVITWKEGNAEDIPFDDNSFDACTIAFGIRNCTHVEKVLQEAYRVLKPGGRFMCLEFSLVKNSLLRWLYDQYSFQVIPVLGQVLARDWDSYQYLVESIRQFPPQEEFEDMMREAGFQGVYHENLTGGVCAIHSGFKL
ncbi:unnamed protein product [Darwinula stevensoni]|uniref:2-methoxy-6-polyprenyl-1,4-benzoquinol methylase, mitochondrial n=1 Tax=Darwinula stevensoni TaxID=69355 RepID=A0A7R8X8F9_9CRUS|nr:unnamed protein product [Darwinula stevensoni]CAG0883316.1 unnamed protein product [Darwinula stevensoni]